MLLLVPVYAALRDAHRCATRNPLYRAHFGPLFQGVCSRWSPASLRALFFSFGLTRTHVPNISLLSRLWCPLRTARSTRPATSGCASCNSFAALCSASQWASCSRARSTTLQSSHCAPWPASFRLPSRGPAEWFPHRQRVVLGLIYPPLPIPLHGHLWGRPYVTFVDQYAAIAAHLAEFVVGCLSVAQSILSPRPPFHLPPLLLSRARIVKQRSHAHSPLPPFPHALSFVCEHLQRMYA